MQRRLARSHLLQRRAGSGHAALVVADVEVATHDGADGVAPLGGRQIWDRKAALRGCKAIGVLSERERERRVDVQRLAERGPTRVRLEIVSGGAAHLAS